MKASPVSHLAFFFFCLSVSPNGIMPRSAALLQIHFFLLHFLRLLATIIETKPSFNKHRIEFRGNERGRMCCVNLDLLCFLIVAISSSMYTFTNFRRERERERVCLVFSTPCPPFFCSG